MAIITTADLAAFMGREFSPSETLQAESLIGVVESVIESETGVSFTYKEDDEIRIQADGHGIVELNSRPIQEISHVYDMDGEELDTWEFDGLRAIYGLDSLQVVDIVYSHGYMIIPPDIKGVALGVASRVMYNPSGLRQETVGAISVTYPGIGGEAGTINFSALERSILAKYQSIGASMRLATIRRRIASLPILTVTNHID